MGSPNMTSTMLPLAFLSLLTISPTLSKLACRTPVVCDPSLESDIYITSSHFLDETQCETSCTIGHPNNPCKFFTWVPNAQDQVPNCYQMKACNEMSDPITGSQSGAWSCEDPEIFCGPMTIMFILTEMPASSYSKTPPAAQRVPVLRLQLLLRTLRLTLWCPPPASLTRPPAPLCGELLSLTMQWIQAEQP